MKKTYPFKSVYVMAVIFGFMFSVPYLYLTSKVLGIESMTSNGISDGAIISMLSEISGFINWGLILLSGLLGIFLVGILFLVYHSKKDKSQGIFIEGLISVVTSAILAFSVKGGSFDLVKICSYVLMANSVFVLFVALRADNVFQMSVLDNFLPQGHNAPQVAQESVTPQQTETTSQENVTQETKETTTTQQLNKPVPVKPIKPFFKTKKGIATIVLAIVVACAYGGYKIWDDNFNKIEMDVFANTKVTFNGFNGAGYAEVEQGTITSDSNDINIANFAETITYQIDHNNDLSNGDTITVKAIYSQDEANKNKIAIKEGSKEYKVEGLTVNYAKASEIDSQIIKEAFKAAETYTYNYQNSDVYMTNDTHEFEYANMVYYLYDNSESEEYKSNKIAFVYKYRYKDYINETQEEYRVVTVGKINSKFSYDDASCDVSVLQNADYSNVKNADDISSAMTRKYASDYSIETIDQDVK